MAIPKQLQGLRYSVPDTWEMRSDSESTRITSPDGKGEVNLRALPMSSDAAQSVAALDLLQRVIPTAYPAYAVDLLFERPIAAGICIEAALRPRRGSALVPGLVLCDVLSRHAVLADFRRRETSSHLDPIVRRFMHGLSERGVKITDTRVFAEHRREQTKFQRLDLSQWQVFLCHRSEDKPIVGALRDALFEHGIVSWIDEKDIGTGDRFVPEIEKGLAFADAVVVARGPHDLSSWQQLEFGVAINQYARRQRAGDRPLKIVPVALPGSPSLGEWAGFLGTFNGVEMRSGLNRTGISKLIRLVLPDGQPA